MMKRVLLAAAGVFGMGLGLVAGPATAQTMAQCHSSQVQLPNGKYIDSITYYADSIQAQLRRNGYDASQIEPWGGCVRAFVRGADGSTTMMYFDPDTLQPLSPNS